MDLLLTIQYTSQPVRWIRFCHHSDIILNARSIGDNMHLRHNTTIGVARRGFTDAFSIIRCGADIGRVTGLLSVDCCKLRLHSAQAESPARAVKTLDVTDTE